METSETKCNATKNIDKFTMLLKINRFLKKLHANSCSITENADNLYDFCRESGINARIFPDGKTAAYIGIINGATCLIELWFDEKSKTVTYKLDEFVEWKSEWEPLDANSIHK